MSQEGYSEGERFQFIEFPSEWGENKDDGEDDILSFVSNLLSSPASGEPPY